MAIFAVILAVICRYLPLFERYLQLFGRYLQLFRHYLVGMLRIIRPVMKHIHPYNIQVRIHIRSRNRY